MNRSNYHIVNLTFGITFLKITIQNGTENFNFQRDARRLYMTFVLSPSLHRTRSKGYSGITCLKNKRHKISKN